MLSHTVIRKSLASPFGRGAPVDTPGRRGPSQSPPAAAPALPEGEPRRRPPGYFFSFLYQAKKRLKAPPRKMIYMQKYSHSIHSATA